MHELWFRLHALDQLIIDFFRIAVHDSDPSDLLDPGQLPDQLMKAFPAIQICPVKGSLLGDQDQFLHAAFGQAQSLAEKAVHRNGAERSSHGRNRAVSAVLVTTLGDLEISVMSARRKITLSLGKNDPLKIIHPFFFSSGQGAVHDLTDGIIGCGSHDGIHFRQFRPDLIRIALRHASGSD